VKLVGRHGVKWPADELAAVLAHELVGHGIQQQRGRLSKIRELDAECEASLYEEIVNQDLGLDKHSREMVAFRQALENHWCTDFKAYLRAQRPSAMTLWNAIDPDVPKLLAVFEAYLEYSARTGVTAKALDTMKRQIRVARMDLLKTAAPEALFRAAVILYDGGIGVAPDPREAMRYFRIAAAEGHLKARTHLEWLSRKGLRATDMEAGPLHWFSRTAVQARDVDAKLGRNATNRITPAAD